MSAQRDKGTKFERLIADYLAERLGDDRIDRMPLHGNDRGDIAGVRTVLGERVVIEAKNHTRLNLAGWIGEAEVERGNADAAVGVVAFKRAGKAVAAEQYVLMRLEDFAILLGAEVTS